MSTQYFAEDILSHINTEQPAEGADLERRAALARVCVDLVSFAGCTLSVCLELDGPCVQVRANLRTPLGAVDLGKATICPDRPCIKIGGGLAGFKAEIEACLVLNPLAIDLKATICAPLVGCTSTRVRIPLAAADAADAAADTADAVTAAPIDDVKVYDMDTGKLVLDAASGNDLGSLIVVIHPVRVHGSITVGHLYNIVWKTGRRARMKFERIGPGRDYFFRQ